MSCIVTGQIITPEADPAPGLNYPRIAYENLLADNANATSDDDNTSLAKNVLTYDTWQRFTAAGSDSVLLLSAITSFQADCVCVGGHNLADVGGSIVVEIDVGEGFQAVGTIVQENRSTAKMLLFEQTEVFGVRLTLSSGGSSPIIISNVFASIVLTMQRPTYSGVTPASLSSNNAYRPQTSDGGQFLGKRIVRRGVQHDASFRHLTDAWIRTYFDGFAIHAQTLPFFYSWNLEEDPAGTIYGWSNDDIVPSKMGIRDLAQVSWQIVGAR